MWIFANVFVELVAVFVLSPKGWICGDDVVNEVSDSGWRCLV